MKKTVLFAVLALICNLAFGQAGALKISNNTITCTAYVNVWAADATTGNPGRCDISTCTIVVPPSMTYSWTNPLDVFTSGSWPAGICGAASPLSVANVTAAMAAGTWIWTDAQLQFQCILPFPLPFCSEGGCYLEGGAQCGLGPGTCLGAGGPTWSASVCSGLTGASWSPAIYCFMTNITISVF